MELESTTVETSEKGKVVISVKGHIANPKTAISIAYTILGNGYVKVSPSLTIAKGVPNTPKIGMQFKIAKTYHKLSYFGKGPQANYQDRNTAAHIGIYKGDAITMSYNYAMPQEYGNHMGTRWFKVLNTNGKGILVKGEKPLNFSVLPYSTNNIDQATHTNELIKEPNLTVNIDLVQAGVGGDNSWSFKAEPHEAYRIHSGTYSYAFYMMPVVSKSSVKNVELVKF